jgi:hypothetical protein
MSITRVEVSNEQGVTETVVVGDLSFLDQPAATLLAAGGHEVAEASLEGLGRTVRVPASAPAVDVYRSHVLADHATVVLVDEDDRPVGVVATPELEGFARRAWANQGNVGGGHHDAPEPPDDTVLSGSCRLVFFGVDNLLGEVVDLATGRHGYAHLALDCGERDQAGRAIVIEAVDKGVKRTYLHAYRDTPLCFVPISQLLRDHEGSCKHFFKRARTYLGQPYDYADAMWGIDRNPAKQICSGLAFEAFPRSLQLQILRYLHEHEGESDDGQGDEPHPHPRISPNGLARFFGLDRAEIETAGGRVERVELPEAELAFRPTLRRGASGQTVDALQRALRLHGFDTQGEAGFGPMTHLAVLDLQRERGMDADGVVDAPTWEHLDVAPDPLEAVPARRGAAIRLDVPYLSQRDNLRHPSGTCNVTCLAMTLLYLGARPVGAGQFEDELYDLIQGPEGEAHYRASGLIDVFGAGWRNRCTIHAMLAWASGRYGHQDRFLMRATWDEIFAHLDSTGPVILAGKFTGAGHLVLLVGRTESGDLIVHDPWGDWSQMYRGAGACPEAGRFAVYDFASAQQVLNKPGDRVWAHFVA